MSTGNRTRATIGTYPSCLAPIRLGNVAAQLALRAQPRRKEQRCCAASASHSGKTKGARPSPPLPTSLPPTDVDKLCVRFLPIGRLKGNVFSTRPPTPTQPTPL